MQLKSRRGQSVVEFIFVVIIFLNLLVVTFNAVMGFAVQQYISYATFMAARAYQASQIDENTQAAFAKATLESYLYFDGSSEGTFKFPGYNKVLARNITVAFPGSGANLPPYGQAQPKETTKIEVSFKVPLFQMPLPGLTAELMWVPLKATSYLGREPTRKECKVFFQNFYRYYNRGGDDLSAGMYDNNC